jgi:hypothetical protein
MSPNDNPLLTAVEQKQLIQNVLDDPDDIFGVYSRRLLNLHDQTSAEATLRNRG